MESAMLERICPKCRRRYRGWALKTRRNQLCVKCGRALDIKQDGVLVRSRFPSFKAEEYQVMPDQINWQYLRKEALRQETLREKNLLYFLHRN
jgi:hypothetical protein